MSKTKHFIEENEIRNLDREEYLRRQQEEIWREMEEQYKDEGEVNFCEDCGIVIDENNYLCKECAEKESQEIRRTEEMINRTYF